MDKIKTPITKKPKVVKRKQLPHDPLPWTACETLTPESKAELLENLAKETKLLVLATYDPEAPQKSRILAVLCGTTDQDMANLNFIQMATEHHDPLTAAVHLLRQQREQYAEEIIKLTHALNLTSVTKN